MVTFVHKDYQIIDSKRVFQGYFAVEEFRFKHRLFKGGWSDVYQREVFERGSAAAVVLYDPNLQQVVSVLHAIQRWHHELPMLRICFQPSQTANL